MSSPYSQLHTQARSLESECDKFLSEYSLLVHTPTVESPLAAQIPANLDERSALIDAMYRLAYEPGASTTTLHQAQRHSEMLDDHKQTFRQLSSEISQERGRQMLLSNVRSDIQSHRATTTAASAASHTDEDQYYGRERSRIDETNSVADGLLARVYEARAELVHQQATLKDVQRRILRVVSQVPGLNSLISKINTRQKRNSLILAAIITTCVCFVFFVR